MVYLRQSITAQLLSKKIQFIVSFVCRAKGVNLMTNKKFKKAAMALALTACVAVTPLAANAEAPEDAALTPAPAAVDRPGSYRR